MRPEHEDAPFRLRATLFHNLLGKAIVFDEYSQAVKYRKYMISEKNYCPVLYSLDGRRIGKDAVLEKSSGGKPSWADLSYAFGEYVGGEELLFPLKRGKNGYVNSQTMFADCHPTWI